MAKKQCDLVPKVNDQDSQMYLDLSKMIKGNRPLLNYIYSLYLQEEVQTQMNSRGYTVNKQGQHNAKDIYNFLEIDKIINDQSNIQNIRRSLGAIDEYNNLIQYDKVSDILDRVRQFNESNKNFIATIVPAGNKFSIIVDPKTANTQHKTLQLEKQIKSWEIIKQQFNSKSIDLTELENNEIFSSIVNPIQSKQFLEHIRNLQLTRFNIMSPKDIQLLLELNKSSLPVQRLEQKFNSLQEAAQEIYASYREPNKYTPATLSLIETALTEAVKFKNINLVQLMKDVETSIEEEFSNNIETSVQETLKELNEKYDLNFEQIQVNDKNINSLKEATAHAIMTIKRQIAKLQNTKDAGKLKNLEKTLKTLEKELDNKTYYISCLEFLKEASNQLLYIEELYNNIPFTGNTMEIARAKAKIINEAKSIKEGYYYIIAALSNIDQIASEENISEETKQNIKEQATIIKNTFDKETLKYSNLAESTMIQIAQEIIGPKTDKYVAIGQIVNIAESDSSIFDYLYSWERMSDPIISSMGQIVRDAQDKRDKIFNEINHRVRVATKKLYAAGYDSKFMYDEDGRIISPYDWETFYRERKKAKMDLYQRGFRNLDLQIALEEWEQANTEEIIVDVKNGRTERVPVYRLAGTSYDRMSPEQKEYYNTMMQIKGELGSLLPEYAQHQFLPPQCRRSFLDAMTSAKSIRDVLKAIKLQIQKLYKPQEGTEKYRKNAVIIDGDELLETQGNFDSTVLKQIPIYTIQKLKDQEELMLDFSAGILRMANTAINYSTMNEVRDVIEFMGDFIKDRKIQDKYVEVYKKKTFEVISRIMKRSLSTRSAGIVESMIDKHLYGLGFDTKDSTWAVLGKNLLLYNSIKGLAMNFKGAVSNLLVGEYQMLIEAGANQYYNYSDYLFAQYKLFGDATKRAPGKIIDFFTHSENSYDVLLSNLFDPVPGNLTNRANKRFHKSFIRNLISQDLTFIGYQTGEHIIHFTTMYAMLHHEKVLINGKKTHLYNAFEKVTEQGTSYLRLKDNVTDLNGNPITEQYLEDLRKRIRYANQNTHGSMNEEDKGLIHQNFWGKAVMNFRQWMVESYSRRYRTSHYDGSIKSFQEGYFVTYGKFIKEVAKDIFHFELKVATHKANLTESQKANIRRARTEIILYLAFLLPLSFMLGSEDDHDGEWWYRFWIYQAKRLRLDAVSMFPVGAALNAKTLVNSPIPAINTVNGLLYPITGLEDIDERYRRGKYRGKNKYAANILRYTVPFYKDIEQMYYLDTEDDIFLLFDNSRKYK